MSTLTFRMECHCGRASSFEPSTDRLECDCGAVYAVTITELRPPTDGSKGSPDE